MEKGDLDRIGDLYERGLYLQAYAYTERYGPLESWEGTRERLIAGRLASNLGTIRLAHLLHLRAYRDAPDDPEARYYYLRSVMDRRGPLAAWRLFQRLGEPDPDRVPAALCAHWLTSCGLITGTMRDWDTAERYLERALKLAPDDAWIHVEQASLLELQDRYDEALASAFRAIELHPSPFMRPAVQSAAHLLELQGRDDEAMDLLSRAVDSGESALLAAQKAILLVDGRQWEEAGRSLDRYEERAPLAEERLRHWLATLRSDIAYYRGDTETAVRYARQADNRFYTEIADRLEKRPAERRECLLPVGFVRQHHVTCAPATLSALSRYWQMPADHLSLAEQICYDGTPDYSERHWAETNGYFVREFRVTWDSAVALIDRGVPFTLTTVNPDNAHLQAVIGYDENRGLLYIRDPYYRYVGEALCPEMLDRYAATGPRGMAMVPSARRELLEDLDLPESDLYDQVYRLQRALQAHRRDEAAHFYDALAADAPGHRLTLHARRALAGYDGDPSGALTATEAMLALYPNEPNLQLTRLSCLRELSQRDERLRILSDLCATRSEKEGEPSAESETLLARGRMPEADHLYWARYASELSADAREHGRAIGLLRRALRRAPTDARSLATLAGIYADQRRFEDALPLYRFAACLEDKDEGLALAYFQAARVLGRTREAMHLLNSRFQRFRAISSLPARTLFWGLRELGDGAGALRVVDEALRCRPNDGDLLLFAASEYTAYGREAEGKELLGRALERAPRSDWLRAAARLAQRGGDLTRARELWNQVTAADPLALDTHRAIVELLAQTGDASAVNAHFRAFCARFPRHYGLHRLWAESLREQDNPATALALLDRLVEINPADGWTRLERARTLGVRCRRLEEAFAEAQEARRLNPHDANLYTLYGDLYSQDCRWAEARAAYTEAIRLSVDHDYAILKLVALCDEGEQRREALAMIRSELARQTIFGDGLLAFRHVARGVLEKADLVAALTEARDARPDLWHAWSALIRQLLDDDRLVEAAGWARSAVARFPLNAQLWLDLADVEAARRDYPAEQKALDQALLMRPTWGALVRRKCAALERDGDSAAVRALLTSAVQRDPADAENRHGLAQVLWKAGEREEALRQVRGIIALEPDFDAAWESLRSWCAEIGRPEDAVAVARDLVRRRPGEASAWYILAATLEGPKCLEERLAALRRCRELNPRHFESCDLMARLLAEAERWDEALAACRPEVTGSTVVPTELKGRAAWIEDQRGNRALALERIREVVRDDGEYLWGWVLLAQWCDEGHDVVGYGEAAKNLTRLAPHEATAWGLYGDSLLQADRTQDALVALQRAFDLNADYTFAAVRLFDLCLDKNDYARARSVVDSLYARTADALPAMLGVRLAVTVKDGDDARRHLLRLCTWPTADDGMMRMIRIADAQYAEAGWDAQAERVYTEALVRDDARPEVGEAWVVASTRRGAWDCARRLPDLRRRGAIGEWATAAYIEALGDSGNLVALEEYVRSDEAYLRSADRVWASVTRAYLQCGNDRAALAWSADWRARTEATAWMHFARVIALRNGDARSLAEARAISRHALSRSEDNTTCLHALWLVLDDALNGDRVSRTLLARSAGAGEEGPYWQFLQQILMAVLKVRDASPGDRSVAFRAARKHLSAARASHRQYRKSKLLVRTYRTAARCIGGEVGGVGARAWSLLAAVLG